VAYRAIDHLAILGTYATNQVGWIGPSDLSYSVANFLGSMVPTVIAVGEQQPGFVLLEDVWAMVSPWGSTRSCVARRRGRPPVVERSSGVRARRVRAGGFISAGAGTQRPSRRCGSPTGRCSRAEGGRRPAWASSAANSSTS